MSSVGCCVGSIENLLVILSVYGALSHRIILAACALSGAIYIGLHPILFAVRPRTRIRRGFHNDCMYGLHVASHHVDGYPKEQKTMVRWRCLYGMALFLFDGIIHSVTRLSKPVSRSSDGCVDPLDLRCHIT